MDFNEYFNNYLDNRIYKGTFNSGNDATVKEFYDNCVKHALLDAGLCERWQKMLVEYSKLDNAIFWIRKYEGGGSSGNWKNRRACLTSFKYKGNTRYYVSVSNYDAQNIFNMIYLGIEPPTAQEFLNKMWDFTYKFHYSDSQTCEEGKFAAYAKVDNNIKEGGPLANNKWYFAHIKGINDKKYKDITQNKLKEITDKLFPSVDLYSWKLDTNLNKYVRALDIDLTDVEYNVLVANFFRFVSPLNYYVVPNSSCEVNDIYSGTNKSIGEYDALNGYVFKLNLSRFDKTIFQEFAELAMIKDFDCSVYKGDEVINVAYRTPVTSKTTNSKRSKSSKKSSSTKSVSTNTPTYSSESLHLAKIYLTENKSLAQLDRDVLGATYDTHGNISYRKLRAMGLLKEHKNILSTIDIDTLISDSTGLTKETLIKVKVIL